MGGEIELCVRISPWSFVVAVAVVVLGDCLCSSSELTVIYMHHQLLCGSRKNRNDVGHVTLFFHFKRDFRRKITAFSLNVIIISSVYLRIKMHHLKVIAVY